jgi:hypothetical protein
MKKWFLAVLFPCCLGCSSDIPKATENKPEPLLYVSGHAFNGSIEGEFVYTSDDEQQKTLVLSELPCTFPLHLAAGAFSGYFRLIDLTYPVSGMVFATIFHDPLPYHLNVPCSIEIVGSDRLNFSGYITDEYLEKCSGNDFILEIIPDYGWHF